MQYAQGIQSHLIIGWQLMGQRGALTVRFRAHNNTRCCMWIDDWVGNAILFSVVVKLYNKGQARVYGCKKGTVADDGKIGFLH